MRAALTPDDLKMGDPLQPIPPGWYPLEIVKYEETITKGSPEKPSDGSTNCVFHFKILDGPAKDRVLRRFYNEKVLGFGKSLYATLGFPKNSNGGYDVSTELFERTVGFKLMGYIKMDAKTKYDSIEDFKPLA
jgi:hypothetical protein